MSGSTKNSLDTSDLGFKLSSEHENTDDNVLNVTKQLIIKKFYIWHGCKCALSSTAFRPGSLALGSNNISVKLLLPTLGYNPDNAMVSFHM